MVRCLKLYLHSCIFNVRSIDMRYIKYFTVLLTLALSSIITLAQDTASIINQQWSLVKVQLLRKTDIAINLCQFISQQQPSEKTRVDNLKNQTLELINLFNINNTLDSLFMQELSIKHERLQSALSKLLFKVSLYKRLRKQQSMLTFQAQLEGLENRISVMVYEFNKMCRNFNRTELIFARTKNGKAPSIEF
jgi:LemA protein